MLNPVTNAVLSDLKSQLPDNVFGADLAPFLEDPRKIVEAHIGAVLRPNSAQEVSTIVKAANQHRVGIVPYGGGTGLVGGQLSPVGATTPAPLVVSLDRMNAVRGVYPRENVMVVEAGSTLAEVQHAADARERLFPLSLASEGTARIGGNLSTNAGGVQVLRYGNARDLCLGLEAVLPEGRIWNGLKRLRKDNTGYDLRGLLIGAEGTLGIITAATLRLFPRPGSVATAMMSVSGPDAALNLLALGQDRIGAGLTAFELIHRQGLDFLDETGMSGADHLDDRPEWTVLIEVALPTGFGAQDAVEALFSTAFENGLVNDGIIANSEAQRAALWQTRESIPEANRRIGSIASHDISVPLEAIPEVIFEGQKRVRKVGDFRVNIFGHLGDGNLHYNFFPQKGQSRDDLRVFAPEISRILHDLVAELGGSFSAEHGVGRNKVDELERLGDPAKLAAMLAIKSALDPNGIMNPGAVLRTGS